MINVVTYRLVLLSSATVEEILQKSLQSVCLSVCLSLSLSLFLSLSACMYLCISKQKVVDEFLVKFSELINYELWTERLHFEHNSPDE